jgi:Flp pilus assembly protein TadG
MKMFALSGMLLRLKPSVALLLRDRSGVAAVEFAMILPLLLVLLFGMIDASSGMAAKRKVTIVAQTVSDLTSRYTSVNDTDIGNFKTIGNAIMTPYSATPLTVTVSEIWVKPSTGKARIQWSSDLTKHPIGSEISTFPADLVGKDAAGNVVSDQYLIYSEVSYDFTPVVGYVMGNAVIKLKDESYTRPRQSTCVYYPAAAAACPTS